jgi:hypothetical protein
MNDRRQGPPRKVIRRREGGAAEEEEEPHDHAEAGDGKPRPAAAFLGLADKTLLEELVKRRFLFYRHPGKRLPSST